MSQAPRVSVVASKVQLITFLPVQFSRMLGKDICLTILKISQLGNSYLKKKTQQSKITNHFSCKFKFLLLKVRQIHLNLHSVLPTFNMPATIGVQSSSIICLYMLHLGQSTRQWYLSHMLWVNLVHAWEYIWNLSVKLSAT